MFDLAPVGLGVLQAMLWLCLAYHYGLLVASIRQPRLPSSSGAPVTRFAVAIPAHNEAAVIAGTVAQLQRQAYPAGLYEIHVIADHCTDSTADCAREAGADVHERDSLPSGRKAFALSWLLDRILDAQETTSPPDALVVFDADSQVDPGFLSAMDQHLRDGNRVLQGQHIISNPEDGLFPAMAAVDMRLNNRLRNQSRSNLGLSSRLMGDAMVLDARLLQATGWLGESMTEDREMGYELLMRGIRVQYVPEARSCGHAARTWREARLQRLRWHAGAAAMRRRLTGRLLAAALRARSLVILDGAIELYMPSYTVLAAASALNLALTASVCWLIPQGEGLVVLVAAALLLTGWGAYPLLGLLADRAPGWAFRALLAGPAYVLWRLSISLRARLLADGVEWVSVERRDVRSQGKSPEREEGSR